MSNRHSLVFGLLSRVAPPIVILLASAIFAQAAEAIAERNIVRDERPGAGAGKSLAILIGVQDYASLPKLKYCRNDVRLLEKTLREACRFDKVIALVEDASNAALRPTLGNISTQLRNWLRVANNGEYQRLLLYFSGHGFRDAKGRLYFAPPDCDRQNLEIAGLPQSYVKQMLDGCTRVPVKLLVLDCCHSGEGRGVGVGESGEEAALEFKTAKGLLTLASCAGDEVSLEWEKEQQGVFTYWLCQGLRGGERGEVDRDQDGVIDCYELHRYLLKRVRETAAEMSRQQTVKLIPSADWQGVAALVRIARPDVEVLFTVREGNATGPLLADAKVTVMYRKNREAPQVVFRKDWLLPAVGAVNRLGDLLVCVNRLVGAPSRLTKGDVPDPANGVDLVCRWRSTRGWAREVRIPRDGAALWLNDVVAQQDGSFRITYGVDGSGLLVDDPTEGEGLYRMRFDNGRLGEPELARRFVRP